MLKKYPMKMRPITKEALWGGDKLKKNYHKIADFSKLAESWELTVRSDGMSIIENGIYAGMTLDTFITRAQADILGKNISGDRFPLLVKFLDARENLSIQVHPDDTYALIHENELGKMEMWYIIEAEPGAQLVYGLQETCSAEKCKEAIASGKTESVLRYIPVKAGECYFIPAGHIHAIGAGILIAEIQQNSNVTYRVYDYNRKQSNGTLRQLHTAQALDVVRVYTKKEIAAERFFNNPPADAGTLCDCRYFRVQKYELGDREAVELLVSDNSFLSVLVISSDHGQIIHDGIIYEITAGDSYFLPAGMGSFSINGETIVLVTSINGVR